MTDNNETAVVLLDGQVPSLLEGTPNERVTQATEIANALAPVIAQKKLYATISGRRFVTYEGWTTLGALVGVFPVLAWTRPIEGGWEARVEARTYAGAVIGAAEAQCTRSESSWKTRDDYALRSMAQTRAGSKALRMPLGFIMALAGYEATPAEEMAHENTPGANKTVPAGIKAATACDHGKREWREGVSRSTGKPLRGWYCKENRCPPVLLSDDSAAGHSPGHPEAPSDTQPDIGQDDDDTCSRCGYVPVGDACPNCPPETEQPTLPLDPRGDPLAMTPEDLRA